MSAPRPPVSIVGALRSRTPGRLAASAALRALRTLASASSRRVTFAAFVAVLVTAALAALTLRPGAAGAASRGMYGGTLRVALAGELGQSDPLLADSPGDAAVLGLVTSAVCRLDREQRITPLLALDLTRDSASEVKVTLKPALRSADGAPLAAQQLAESWMRLNQNETRSPYRALLFPLRGEGRYLAPGSNYTLPLSLAFPWPDLEKSLCHPALAMMPSHPQRAPGTGAGPLLPSRALGVYVANWSFPGGRPYVDRLTVTAGDVRAASRVMSLGDAELGLGANADGFATLPPAPALFATYLAFRPQRVGTGFRDNFERLIDRTDLTRIFVRAPSVPMSSLLPPALMPQTPVSRGGASPAPQRELTLLYDLTLPDQRAVAERLQVKLHDAGYRVSLRGQSRSALRAKWASGDFDLMLHAVLLPPVSAPAFAVMLDTAGRHDLLARELPPIGALADPHERDVRVRERAQALRTELSLLPLYAQSLRVVLTPKVAGVDFDAHGIPTLADAFFPPPAPAPLPGPAPVP